MSAEAILANIAAMEHAITTTSSADTITVPAIVEVHRVLMANTRDAHIAGVVRTRQNWIGGNNHSPRGAAFVPPPEDEIDSLLTDLATFMNRRDLSPTLQAAIAHAQFETIHPFADGNGRTGRCLIHVVYRRAALASRFVPPVSLVLATDGDAYVKGLTAYRAERTEDWYLDFALTVIRACRAARQLAAQIDELEQRWITKAGDPRRDSTARKLIQLLPAQPILRVSHVVALTGASPTAAHNAVNELEKAGVLKQVTVGKRNRAWEAVGLLKLIDEFERRLATPDIGADKPARPAPFDHRR
jgi:Fic family protein